MDIDPKTVKRGDKLVVQTVNLTVTTLGRAINQKTGGGFEVGDVVTVRYLLGLVNPGPFLAIEECPGPSTWALAAFRKQRFVETLQPGYEVKVVKFGCSQLWDRKNNVTGQRIKVGDVLTVKEAGVGIPGNVDFDWVKLVEVDNTSFGTGFNAACFRKYTVTEKMTDVLAKQIGDDLVAEQERYMLSDVPKFFGIDYGSLPAWPGSLPAWRMNCLGTKSASAADYWRQPAFYEGLQTPSPGYREGWNAGYNRGARRCSCGERELGTYSNYRDLKGVVHVRDRKCDWQEGTVGCCYRCYRNAVPSTLVATIFKETPNASPTVFGYCKDEVDCARARCGATPLVSLSPSPGYKSYADALAEQGERSGYGASIWYIGAPWWHTCPTCGVDIAFVVSRRADGKSYCSDAEACVKRARNKNAQPPPREGYKRTKHGA